MSVDIDDWLTASMCDGDSVNINAQDDVGCTKLHHAIFYKRTQEMFQLLSQGADCNIQDKTGHTPLHVAIRLTEISIRGPDRHSSNPENNQEMQSEDGLLAVQEMLKCGANPNIRTHLLGHTPLHWAIMKTRNARQNKHQGLDLVRMLLQDGADPNMCDKNGRNSISLAVSESAPLEVIQLLVAGGGDPLVEDHMGRNLLHLVKEREYETTVSEVIDYLLQLGCDLSMCDGDGNTVLHGMVNTFGITYMLHNGVEINAQNYAGQTPLHQAVERDDRYATVDFLLRHKANPDVKDKQGNTALHSAAIFQAKDNIQLLIRLGCNINVQNNEGKTALHSAIGTSCFMCYGAALQILAHVEDTNVADKQGRTPLLELARSVMKYRPFVSREEKALFDLFHELLKMKCDPNHQDANGNTALIVFALDMRRTIEGKMTPFVLQLIEYGADIAVHNYAGQSFHTLFSDYHRKNPVDDAVQKIEDVLQVPSLQCLCVHTAYLSRERFQGFPCLPNSIKSYLNLENTMDGDYSKAKYLHMV